MFLLLISWEMTTSGREIDIDVVTVTSPTLAFTCPSCHCIHFSFKGWNFPRENVVFQRDQINRHLLQLSSMGSYQWVVDSNAWFQLLGTITPLLTSIWTTIINLGWSVFDIPKKVQPCIIINCFSLIGNADEYVLAFDGKKCAQGLRKFPSGDICLFGCENKMTFVCLS